MGVVEEGCQGGLSGRVVKGVSSRDLDRRRLFSSKILNLHLQLFLKITLQPESWGWVILSLGMTHEASFGGRPLGDVARGGAGRTPLLFFFEKNFGI